MEHVSFRQLLLLAPELCMSRLLFLSFGGIQR